MRNAVLQCVEDHPRRKDELKIAATRKMTNLSFVVVSIIGFLTVSTYFCYPTRDQRDGALDTFQNKRTCWWNEICKKEFQQNFECRCPRWSYCRGPGRYYDAYCSMTQTGYVWQQQHEFTSQEK